MSNMVQAIRMALHVAEERHDLTDVFGEDVGPPLGGAFTATQGIKSAWNSPLDERGMVVDLEQLDAELKAVRAELDGRDLELLRPAEAEAVTVEVLARWVWDRLAPLVLASGAGELSVRVYESPVAFGGYRAPVS